MRIDENIYFPLNYADLSPNAQLVIDIYDMKKPRDRAMLCSTTVSLFDSKLRLRQGVHNLLLWKGVAACPGLDTTTPGLPPDHQMARDINTMLAKIDGHTPNKKLIDEAAENAVMCELLTRYLESDACFLEVKFPEFGSRVLFNDSLDKRLKTQYIFPQNLLKAYSQESHSSMKESLSSSQISSSDPFSGVFKFHDPLIMTTTGDFLRRANPITEKYYTLTRDLDDSVAKDLRPNKEEVS